MTPEPDFAAFAATAREFLDKVVNAQPVPSKRTPLGVLVEEYLETTIDELPVVTEQIAGHRLVDADIALAELAGGGRLIGVSHGQMGHQEELSGRLSNPYVPYEPGAVEYVFAATGPTTTRQVVADGMRFFEFEGHRVVVAQRAARPEQGRATATVEVLVADAAVASTMLERLRELMLLRSVLRGQVLTFSGNEYGNSAAGADFLLRPSVSEDDVILADGALETIRRHVVGIGAHRDQLLAAGQHLKRGVLLYGPPGTGKTLTVRHLLAATPGTTAVVLSGTSIRFVAEAAELARAIQPSIVVIEDIDLIAGDRQMHGGPQPLLFTVLDALDGLDGDADVAFVLTTNRVELLESALSERPGRVDLAVEIDLPDAAARRRLFSLYSRGLPLSAGSVDAAADAAAGVTGSFAKELMRRAVLRAAEDGREVSDADLATAVDELLSAKAQLTRTLLGARAEASAPRSGVDHVEVWHGGSYVPLQH